MKLDLAQESDSVSVDRDSNGDLIVNDLNLMDMEMDDLEANEDQISEPRIQDIEENTGSGQPEILAGSTMLAQPSDTTFLRYESEAVETDGKDTKVQ